MAGEQTLNGKSKTTLGVVYTILGFMVPGVFLAGTSYQKMSATEDLGKSNASELKEFRAEVKGEFKILKEDADRRWSEIEKRMTALDIAIQKKP